MARIGNLPHCSFEKQSLTMANHAHSPSHPIHPLTIPFYYKDLSDPTWLALLYSRILNRRAVTSKTIKNMLSRLRGQTEPIPSPSPTLLLTEKRKKKTQVVCFSDLVTRCNFLFMSLKNEDCFSYRIIVAF